MKKILSVLLIILIFTSALPMNLLSVSSSAEGYGYYTYSVSDEGAVITDVSIAISGDVTIPSTIEGHSVVKIGKSAFKDCVNLTSLSMPDTITEIGDLAFVYCVNLKSVTLSNKLTTIGAGAFQWCEKLESIYIPNSVKIIGKSAFSICQKLTNVIVPNSVVTIGLGAFYGCTNLESITLPFLGESILTTKNTNFGYIFGAEDYQKQNSYISSKLKEVIITAPCNKIDKNAFFGCKNITTILLPSTLIEIGDWGFYYCENLENIVLPDGLLKIGSFIFYGCKKITSVEIPDSVLYKEDLGIGLPKEPDPEYCSENFIFTVSNGEAEIIDYPEGMGGEVVIPNKLLDYPVKAIKSFAFADCTEITSITVPDSVDRIGVAAFENCTSLTSITLPFVGSSRTANGTYDAVLGYIFYPYEYNEPNTTKQYFKDSQYRYYAIPSSLKSVTITDAEQIPYGAFYNCKKLDSITIYDGVGKIGKSAFYNTPFYNNQDNWNNDVLYLDNYLIEAKNTISGAYTVNESTTVIGDYAFAGSKITGIAIPDSVVGIGDYSFHSCYSLSTIAFPKNLKTIGEYAFVGCGITGTLEISDSVNFIGRYAFWGCSRITEVVLSNSISEIEYGTFDSCSKLTDIVIPNNVTKVGTDAFRYCTSLSNLTLSQNLKIIGECAFYNCDSLTDIIIPPSVTQIGNSAFRESEHIKSVTFSKNLKLLSPMVFDNCSSIADVYFYGSKFNKTAISGLGRYDYNDTLVNAEWHYIYVSGDVNNDGDSSLTDVVSLAQVVANWDVVYNDSAVDTDGSGVVDLQDVTLLAQHLAEWDVTIH